MPTRDTAPTGAPCWIDLLSSDVERSRSFYGELFGWTSESAGDEYGGYVNFSLNGRPVAGLMGKTPETQEMPDGWSIYFQTDDAQKTADAATANGGSVAMPVMPVPQDGHLGHMAFLADPAGGFFGVWQPGEHAGFQVVTEHGAPSWFELLTRDHAAAVPFYAEVLRWDTQSVSDTDEFRYTTMVDPAAPADAMAWLAGIMDASSFPDDADLGWWVYLGTDDADATAAKATTLGGTIVSQPEDTEYGRIAAIQDPTGARFKIVQAPADT